MSVADAAGHHHGMVTDFAREKPAVYRAFEQMAICSNDGNTEVHLANGMCQDRHMQDFLLCLHCWLSRNLGDPRSTGRAWRLRCLDLSRNALSDRYVLDLMDTLKRLDVRVERLRLSGNCISERGLVAITEYIWNCPNPLLELDIADNQIMVKAAPQGNAANSDAFSAMLRCLYNHASYPYTVEDGKHGRKVAPLLLKAGGNMVQDPARLVHEIEAQGGKEHMRICATSDWYPHRSEEFLSICLPDFFTTQRVKPALGSCDSGGVEKALVAGATVSGGGRGKRSRSARRRRRSAGRRRRSGCTSGSCVEVAREKGAATTQAPALPPSAVATKSEQPVPPTSGACIVAKNGLATDNVDVGNRGSNSAGSLHGSAAQQLSPSRRDGSSSSPAADRRGSASVERWRPSVGFCSSSPSASRSSRGRAGKRGGSPKPTGVAEGQLLTGRSRSRDAGARIKEEPSDQAEAGATLGSLPDSCRAPARECDDVAVLGRALNEKEQKLLQEQVSTRLQGMEGLPSVESTREMLAEFLVCMVVVRKGLPAIRAELETFLGRQAPSFLDWFVYHVRQQFGCLATSA